MKGRKRGRGAEERRQLRRQLAVAEARIEELEEVVGDRDLELVGLTTEVVVGLEEVVRVVKEKEEQAVVKEWRMKGAVEKERMEWLEKEGGWRAELRKEKGMRVRAERAVAELEKRAVLERERQWAAEVVAVRRAMRKAGRMEVLSKELREEKEHRRVLEERVRKLEEGGRKRGREAEREAEEGWLRRRRASGKLSWDRVQG